jgi:hypothetical protein
MAELESGWLPRSIRRGRQRPFLIVFYSFGSRDGQVSDFSPQVKSSHFSKIPSQVKSSHSWFKKFSSQVKSSHVLKFLKSSQNSSQVKSQQNWSTGKSDDQWKLKKTFNVYESFLYFKVHLLCGNNCWSWLYFGLTFSN